MNPLRWFAVMVALLSAMAVPGMSPAHAAPPPASRITLDLGTYRGWWQLTGPGAAVQSGACAGVPRCRPWLSLADGDYTLQFSDEPQTEKIAFKVAAAGVTLAKPSPLATAADHTLTLTTLKPVTFVLNGYAGPWMLGNWTQPAAGGYFGNGGGSQTVDLVPLTTYGLVLGAGRSERFYVSEAGKVTLIDDTGAVRLVNDGTAPPRLEAQIIDVAIYPKAAATARPFRWILHNTAWGAGRRVYEGPVIVRLVQGSAFQVSEPRADDTAAPIPTITTGKGCNMVTQRVTTLSAVISAVPILASCETSP